MTNFTRRNTHRGGRVEKVVMFVATAALLSGCDDDRANNSTAREPIAITESGIEIIDVTRRMDERIVEAVIVAGGEERQVTVQPLLDGPLPSGVTTTLLGSDDRQLERRSYGWDANTGASFVRQESEDGVFEMTQTLAGGRVVEEYRFNHSVLRLEYAQLAPEHYDKITSKYLRGESLDDTTPAVQEFASSLRQFDEFASQLPASLTQQPEDDVIGSLLNDRVFVSTVTGEELAPTALKDMICNFFNTCAAFSCRFFGGSQVCTICLAGSLACLFLEWICTMWCGG